MTIKILKVQKSNRPIAETKLSINGISTDASSTEQAYEMRVDIFEDEISLLPIKTIILKDEHYNNSILKYGMVALLRGVEIASLLDITQEPGDNSIDHYKREAESIAHSIVSRMEQDTFYDNYSPENMKDYIEDKILKLRDKFKIEPK